MFLGWILGDDVVLVGWLVGCYFYCFVFVGGVVGEVGFVDVVYCVVCFDELGGCVVCFF